MRRLLAIAVFVATALIVLATGVLLTADSYSLRVGAVASMTGVTLLARAARWRLRHPSTEDVTDLALAVAQR